MKLKHHGPLVLTLREALADGESTSADVLAVMQS